MMITAFAEFATAKCQQNLAQVVNIRIYYLPHFLAKQRFLLFFTGHKSLRQYLIYIMSVHLSIEEGLP